MVTVCIYSHMCIYVRRLALYIYPHIACQPHRKKWQTKLNKTQKTCILYNMYIFIYIYAWRCADKYRRYPKEIEEMIGYHPEGKEALLGYRAYLSEEGASTRRGDHIGAAWNELPWVAGVGIVRCWWGFTFTRHRWLMRKHNFVHLLFGITPIQPSLQSLLRIEPVSIKACYRPPRGQACYEKAQGGQWVCV